MKKRRPRKIPTRLETSAYRLVALSLYSAREGRRILRRGGARPMLIVRERIMPYVGRDEYYEEPLARASAMWTDLYELTMAQALFLDGRHTQIGTFHAFIRQVPFNAAYLLTAGQNIVYEWLDKNWSFTDRDIARLAAKTIEDCATGTRAPLFKPDFLTFLKNATMELSITAMPEGEIGFAAEPVFTVTGPVWQALIVETAILNVMNSQSNFATLASIIKQASNGKPVAEFGLRRAQAIGGLEPSRAGYIGGMDATSNCWAETNYGIPTIGTMAHAYIMMHDDEAEAFAKWAEHNPYLGVFLVDTYNTLGGVKRAIDTCRAHDVALSGIRLDSGDLNYLSGMARALLDRAGYKDCRIIVSNDLDADVINALEQQSSPIDMYVAGTNFVTAKAQPALGGVYKIANVYDDALNHEEIMALRASVRSGLTEPKQIRDKVRDIMKLSEHAVKMTYPGEIESVRYLKEENGALLFDGGTIHAAWDKDPVTVSDADDYMSGRLNRTIMSVRRDNHIVSKTFHEGARAYRPQQPVFVRGALVGDIETVQIARQRAQTRLAMLEASHTRLVNPHEHVVGVEESLLQRQESMARRLRMTGNAREANNV